MIENFMKINIQNIIRKCLQGSLVFVLAAPVCAVVDPCNGGSGATFLLSDASFTNFNAASIATKTAGQPFSPYIIMYGNYIDGDGNPQCGVNTTYNGTYNINFTNTYVNPSSGTIALLLDPTGGAGVSTISSSSVVAFTHGVATVTFRYDDVGSIQIGASQGTTSGSSSFVVKPADFNITTLTPTPSSSPMPVDETGPVFGKAGAPFAVTVTVVNALGAATPNYGQESFPQGIEVYSSNLVSPAGGFNGQHNDGVLLNGTAFTMTAPGIFYNNTVAFDEVGIIQLSARVSGLSYLDAGNVISSTPSQNVGRFTPDHFSVGSPTLGKLATGCSSFTYLGQPISFISDPNPGIAYARIYVMALAQTNTPTKNYQNSYWKLSPPAMTVTSNIPNVTVNGGVTSAAISSFQGAAYYQLDTTGFSFQPDSGVLIAPVNAEIGFTYSLTDSDGVTGDQPSYAVGATTTGNGIPFDTSNQMLHGRIRLSGANGPVGLTLNMPLSVEYYDGAGFSRNINDTCTIFTGSNFALSLHDAYPTGVAPILTLSNNSTVTPAVDSFTDGAGRAVSLSLLQGQAPIPGFVDVVMDVYDTAPWLSYPWDGGLGDANGNPIARAIFGLPATDVPVIFRQESFSGTFSRP
jgi:MSHA biogenesis protein MshQ